MLLNESYHPPVSYPQQQQQAPNLQQRASQTDNFYNSFHQPHFFATPDPDLDFLEANTATHSLSSSPLSTQSILSQYSNIHRTPLSGFDNIPTIAVPREAQQSGLFDVSSSDAPLFATSDLMNQDQWFSGHSTPGHPPRFSSHHREPSLSSLGSAGPASPYSHNTSNPHIAVADSSADAFHSLPNADDFSNYQVASKAFQGQDTFYANYPNYASADATNNQTYNNHTMTTPSRQQKAERGLLPPPEFQGSHNGRSGQVSVASSVTSDSPLTPAGDDEFERRRKIAFNAIPKLDRTMTDIYSDELFNPNLTITSAPPTQMTVSPSNEVFAQRLQAANSQHLSAAHSPVSAPSRDRSPFQHGSPLAPAHDFSPSNMQTPHVVFNTAQQLREQRKREQDAQAIEQQLARSTSASTPQTISPKDALLEYHPQDGEADYPLFQQQAAPSFNNNQNGMKTAPHSQQSFDGLSLDANSFGNFGSSQLPNMQFPQHFPILQRNNQQNQLNGRTPLSNSPMSAEPSRVGSTESFRSQSTHTENSGIQRPAHTGSDGGTYTCTYHGCTQRFETPALLQKHKREGHRQAHGLGGPRRPESAGEGMTQAGPHRCDRINPSTGKPCDTVFSRPYDLTRHEDTIHNTRKEKVHCHICPDGEKTFSRADALTRHFRVCHPEVEFPGKHRRRAVHN